MKNIVRTSAIIIALASLTACGAQTNEPAEDINLVEKTAIVTNIDNDEITFTTEDGNNWVWILDEGEHFEKGVDYTLTFDTLGTDTIYDDEIVSID